MKTETTRLPQLDVLRGLAALAVVFYHLHCAIPVLLDQMDCGVVRALIKGDKICSLGATLTSATPLRAWTGGTEAVILFFVLSGFVLSLPFLKGQGPSYGEYIVRRVCRIYIPAAVSILAAALAIHLLQPRNLGLGIWLAEFWLKPVDFASLAANLALSETVTGHQSFNVVMWSLNEEMRFSLVMPFLVLLMLRLKPGVMVMWALAIAIVGYAGAKHSINPSPFLRSLATTGFFGLSFVVGMELARAWLDGRIARLMARRFVTPLLAVAALLLYTSMAITPNYFAWYIMVVTGSAIAVLLAAAWTMPESSLNRSFQWLGRVSYSLYLTHTVVLLTLVHALHGVIDHELIVFAVLPISLLVAGLYWRAVENPAMKLGRLLSKRFAPSRTLSSPEASRRDRGPFAAAS